MKLRPWAVAALMLGALTAGGFVFAQEAIAPIEPEPAEDVQSELGSYQDADLSADYDGSDAIYAGASAAMGAVNRPVQLVFGAEFIYARASFSEALAYVAQDQNAAIDTYVEFDFDHDPSYSFYGGFYLPDCGGAVIFDYTRLASDASFAAASTPDVDIFGQYEIDDNLVGVADVDLKSYDLGFTKTIPLGCALSCPSQCGDCCEGSCDDCCDPCGRWCPAWDLAFTGGIRFADVDWGRNVTRFNVNAPNVIQEAAFGTMSFEGFGGRAGVLGRRYFGRRGLVSAYAKGDLSLLFGEMSMDVVVIDANNDAALTHNEGDRIVPVTEIELGVTAHIGSRASLSAGYFWAGWHDLGMRDVYFFPQFQLSQYDDANILGFDGLFARAELTF